MRGLASKTGLDFFEIVGPFWMRSVISDALVVGNDELKLIPPPADGGTLRGFSLRGVDTLDGALFRWREGEENFSYIKTKKEGNLFVKQPSKEKAPERGRELTHERRFVP